MRNACTVGAAILLMAASTGCSLFSSEGNKAAGGSSEPALTLKVLYGTAESGSEAVIDAARRYEQLTGIDVEISTFTYQNLQGKVISELGRNSGEYDLLALDASWMPRIIQHLEPLSGYIRDSGRPESIALDDFIPNVFFDASVFSAADPNRRLPDQAKVNVGAITEAGFDVYGLPIQASALIGSYRKDLFADKRERDRFRETYGRELEPPRTLDEYLAVARYFTREAGPSGKPAMYGTTLMAGAHESLFVEFHSLLSAFGGSILDEGLRPVFHLEPGIRALETYGSWLHADRVAPPDALSATWEEAGLLFSSGQAAMGLNYHAMELDPRIRTGTVGYFVLPAAAEAGGKARGPQIVSWSLSVNRYSAHKRQAYELAEYLTSPEVQKDALRFKQLVTRQSAYEHAKTLLFSAHREYYEVLGQSIASGTVRPRLTNYNQVSEAIQSAVRDFAIGKKSAPDALADAARQVETMLEQAGEQGR